LQENLLRSHAVGMGPLLSIPVSRLALALRINALAKGYSGVTVALIETLIEMYNRGVVPAIPEQGSVGASGDLAPLAHMALGVMTVEATRSSVRPFDARIQEVRPHPGQAACATNLRRLLEDSAVTASHAACAKVQDAYSLRCMPQVHGAFRASLDHVTRIVEI